MPLDAPLRAMRLLRASTGGYDQYARHPNAYARQQLGMRHWWRQRQIARCLTRPPYRVLVKAAHLVGKTHLAGGLVNWWYDTFNPGLCLTTAPTDRQVRDLLWKEVRTQRGPRPGFRGPKMPRLESSPDHFAHGFATNDQNAFVGHHSPHILLIFDEAVGVAPEFWEAAESMFGGQGHGWLCIFNPTDASSQAAVEERKTLRSGKPKWTVLTMPATEHPNIEADLAGLPPPYPAAIRLERLNELLEQWSTALEPGEPPEAGDIEWPPLGSVLNPDGPKRYLRPGPIAECRLLARWPSTALNAVWSDAVWEKAATTILPAPKALPEYGVDVARFGDDFTEIHGKRGGTSIHHEAHNGWSTAQTVTRLKQIARADAAKYGVSTKRIVFKVDVGGMGAGVVDHSGPDFTFIGINSSHSPLNEDLYPNKRSELWFAVRDLAARGKLSLARLASAVRDELRRQATAPRYNIDSHGRLVVEAKDDTKDRLGRSPDGMDAVNLAYAAVGPGKDHVSGQVKQ